MSSPEESDDSTEEMVIPPDYSGEKLVSSLIYKSKGFYCFWNIGLLKFVILKLFNKISYKELQPSQYQKHSLWKICIRDLYGTELI